jgi:hypothetical protein
MTATVAPTGIGGRAAEWIGYQLAVHPRLRHVTMIWLCGQLLAVWAVITAPRAAAAPALAVLDFTGLTDSRGVPLAAYYLSTVSAAEAIMEAGPDLSINPDSWVRWLSESLTTGLTHNTVAAWLQMQATIYIAMMAAALFLLQFVLSSQWLTWLATWFRPLFDALQLLVVDLYLFPICLAIGLAVGAFHVTFNNRMGHGWRVILSTVVIGVLGFIVTRDPVAELGSQNGLLAQARYIGLDVSSAAIGNAAIAPAGTNKMAALTQSLVDAMVRAPLQLFNFGTPIDGIGGCAAAWDNAIRSQITAAPAQAMKTCGAAQQLAYAQHLDGSSLGLGLFFLLFGGAFAFFILYVAYSYVMVACAAFVNAVMLVFAAPLAMIDGAPRQRAWRRFTEFFRHVILVFAYVLYLSFAAVIVKKISATGGYADQVDMTTPFAKLFLTALVAVAAIGVFAWLKKQLGDQVRQNLTTKVHNTAAAGRAGVERGQRHNARAGATLAAAKAGGAPPGPEGDGPDGAALTGQPSPGRNGTSGSRSAGRSARIYRAAKAGVATAAAPEAVAAKAAAGVATKAAAGAANRARPGSTPPGPATQGATPPATPGTRSAGAGLARAAGYTAAAVVPPSVARAAGYVTGLAGGSRAVTATKDRLRNGKSPAPTPVDENDVADALNAQTPSAPKSSQPGPPPPDTNPHQRGSEPTPGRSG